MDAFSPSYWYCRAFVPLCLQRPLHLAWPTPHPLRTSHRFSCSSFPGASHIHRLPRPQTEGFPPPLGSCSALSSVETSWAGFHSPSPCLSPAEDRDHATLLLSLPPRVVLGVGLFCLL